MIGVIRNQSTGGETLGGIATEWLDKFNLLGLINSEGAGRHRGERLSAVAAAHRIYTSAIASLPVAHYRREGDRREPAHDENLDRLLKLEPNEAMSPFVFRKILVSQAFWYGIGAAYIQRDGLGRPRELIPLDSQHWDFVRSPKDGSEWYLFQHNGETRKFQASELLLQFFETYDGKRGRGMVAIARDTMEADALAVANNREFYKNGARISGIVQTDQQLNKAARDRLKEEFNAYVTGMDDAYRVAVLDMGLKFNALGISPADAQYIQTRQFSVEEISRFTGVPAYMLQTGKQSYNSNEQQQLDFCQNTLLAPVTQMEQEWTRKLLRPRQRERGEYIRFNMDGLLRGAYETRMKAYGQAVLYGLNTLDEIRAREELNPLPGGLGQIPFITRNVQPIQQMTAGSEPEHGGGEQI